MSRPTNSRTELNNTLAKRSLLTPVIYDDVHTGPLNNGTWTSTVTVGGVIYGSGYGSTKGAAREEAARHALKAMNAQGS